LERVVDNSFSFSIEVKELLELHTFFHLGQSEPLLGHTLTLLYRIWIKPLPIPLTISYEIYKLWINTVGAGESVDDFR